MTSLAARCSALTRSLGVSPIGSAGAYDGFVLVEHPLPWGKDVGDDAGLAPVLEAIERAKKPGERWRVQALVPATPVGDDRRAIVYRAAEDGTGYRRTEGPRGDIAALMAGPGEVPTFQDVLICTHGRRDVCCGTAGTELWKLLSERLHVLGPSVRLWRTSHTGGHRFAPTAIVFPRGQYWAWLDAEVLRRVVHREGDVAAIAAHYRGSAAMATPALQAAEREAFVAEGWDWLDYRKWSREDADTGNAVIEFERPDGSRGRYDVTVTVERMMGVPICGEPIEAATKSEPDLRVTRVVPLPTGSGA